ncbi:MAG: hypothetical protein ACJA1W_001829 [Akkermansiaceae bacterium]
MAGKKKNMSDKKDELKAKSKQEALENNNEQTLAQSLDEVFRQRSPVSRDDISATRSRKRPVNNSPSVKKMAVDERGSLDDFDDSDFSFVPEENSAKLGDDKTKPKSPGTVPAKTPEELPFGEAAVKDIQANEPQKKDSSAKVKPVVPKVVPVRIDPSKVYPKSSSPEKTAIGGSLESKTLEKPETSKAPATVAPSVPKAKPVQPALGKVHPEKSDPKSTETSKESPASLSPKNAAIGGPLVSKGPEKPEINKAPATLAPSVPKAGPVQPALGKIGPKKSDPKSAETSKESPASLSPKKAAIGGPLVSKGPEKPEINKAPATVAPSVPKAEPVQPALGKIAPKKSDPESEDALKKTLPLPPLNDPKPEVKKEEQSRSTPVSEPVQIKPKAEEMEVVSSNEKKSTSLSQPGSSTKAVSKWAFWRRSSQRDEQLARISDGYVEMVDLVRAIRGQLESQNENNVILRDSLAHLPEAMKGLESFSKSQHTVGEALQEIHGQMKHHSFKDEKLANSMEGFNTTLKGMDDTSKATMQTFDRVQERMRDSDIRMENLFQNVQSAEEKVSDTMVRLQRNMAIMQGIFLFCLIIVIGVLVLTVMKKDNESRTPAQNSAVQPSQPGGQPAGVRPGEVVVPPISEDGR